MTLSLTKLQDFLLNQGLVPVKYYIMDGYCFYAEIFAVKTADVFLLYFPSKYNFQIPKSEEGVYKVKYINMESKGDIANNYAGEPTDLDLDDIYGGENIHLSPDNEHFEAHLEDNYKHQISLKMLSQEDVVDLKSVYRQVRRLQYSVENLKYKIAILYKNYICSVRRDNSISCLNIKRFPRSGYKKMFVVVDLETLYEKKTKLLQELEIVRKSLHKLLEKGSNTHSSMIIKLLHERNKIRELSSKTQEKKRKYEDYTNKLEKMLKHMNNSEMNTLDSLKNIHQIQGVGGNLQETGARISLEKELRKISVIKEQIIQNMLAIREKKENNILTMDKIMFDNTVMMDKIIKNFSLLKEIIGIV